MLAKKMKGKILAIFFLFHFTSYLSLNAQWARTYGGSEDDYAYSVQQTSDGGYIVVGETRSFGDELGDLWILKLNSGGDIEWQKTYGRGYSDGAYSIQQTNDGGYIVAGVTKSFGAGSSDIWILKLNSEGDIEWQKTYGGSGGEIARSIQQTNDGGFIVAGNTTSFGAGQSDICILKLSSNGDIEWQKSYGGSESESAYSIQQTNDGGYVVAGETRSFGAENEDIWILKLASDGTIEWQKTYGGSQEEEASSIQQTGDGGYIVAGSTASYGAGKRDFLILKLSSNGDIDPACRFIRESDAEVSDSGISPADTDIDPADIDITSQDTDIISQESEALVYSLCSGEHTLSLSAASGGTTNPLPGTYIYDHAARMNISASPDDGYNFSEWSGDVSGTDRLISIIMDSDKSLKANFNRIVVEDVWEEEKKTPCFIATAAYGSPLHPYVRILRDFKDKYLIPSRFGRVLVDFYYKYSPFIAELIAKHKVLKFAVRINLLPLVAFSYSMVHFGPVNILVVTGFIFVLPLFLLAFWRKRIKRLKNYDR